MLRAFSSRNMGGDEVLGSGMDPFLCNLTKKKKKKKAKEILEIDFFKSICITIYSQI